MDNIPGPLREIIKLNKVYSSSQITNNSLEESIKHHKSSQGIEDYNVLNGVFFAGNVCVYKNDNGVFKLEFGQEELFNEIVSKYIETYCRSISSTGFYSMTSENNASLKKLTDEGKILSCNLDNLLENAKSNKYTASYTVNPSSPKAIITENTVINLNTDQLNLLIAGFGGTEEKYLENTKTFTNMNQNTQQSKKIDINLEITIFAKRYLQEWIPNNTAIAVVPLLLCDRTGYKIDSTHTNVDFKYFNIIGEK